MTMKKFIMTLAAALCCVMSMTVLTACEKDHDGYDYQLIVEPKRPLTGLDAQNWRNAVLDVYETALGVGSEEFTKQGTQEECDKEVLEACKRAEGSLRIGGTGEIVVQNNTTRQTVYRSIMQ